MTIRLLKHGSAVFIATCLAVTTLLAGVMPGSTRSAAADTSYTSFRPGGEWLDDNGEPIQGHGGQVVTTTGADGNPLYYWYGEDRTNGYPETPGVHVYSSTDLYNWTDEGVALRTMRSTADFDQPYFDALYGDYTAEQKDAVYRDLGVVAPDADTPGAILERPKVIYNERTDQWVMWVHADGPTATSDAQYAKATAGVAVSDSPTGPFRYIDSWRLNRVAADDPTNAYPSSPGMARDMNLFVDDDGTGYIIYSSEENLTLYISKLDADYTYLSAEPAVAVEGVDFRRPQPWVGGQREAPAITKVGETYYLLTSGATGWAPNAAQYATSTDLLGEWTAHGSPVTGSNASTTCNSQSSSLLNLGDGRVVYIGDRWNNAQDLYRAPSVWLPVTFAESGAMSIDCDTGNWTLDQLPEYTPWQVTTPLPQQWWVGESSRLPSRVGVDEGGVTKRMAVTWDASTLDVPGPRTITGTLADGRTFTRPVTVLPRGLRYLVNAGGQATADVTAARTFAQERGLRLLNSTPEQRWGEDAGTGADWGYLGTTGGTYGSEADTMVTTLRWQADNTDLTYRFADLPKGDYRVDVGFWDPWTQYAPGRAAAVMINNTQVAASQRIDASEQVGSYRTTVAADGRVELTVRPTTRYGIQLSWIMISAV